MKVLFPQSCPTLCDPMDSIALQVPLSVGCSRQEYWSGLLLPSPGDLPDSGIEPGSPALQADSSLSEPSGKPPSIQFSSVQSLSHVQLFATPWTVARQAPLFMGFSRQEYWSGLPLPSPGDLPDSGMELRSPAWAGGFFITEPPGKPEQEIGRAHV